ncbi:MAG: hypothetical protein NTW87_20755 [Planctomycetota bacterium]|nr:hypothetical protein [Planctomycetota bacterium]
MLRRVLRALLLLAVVPVGVAWAGEQIIVVEQQYNIVEQAKDGPQAKDIRQVLYIHKDIMCIDEYGGKDNKPTESIVLDLKNKKIVNLNHLDKRKVTEDFDARRKRIERRKKNAEEDRAAQPPGPQRDKLDKLYRALLDDKRHFALAPEPGPGKTILGVNCKPVKVLAEGEPDYAPLEAQLHPDLVLPYDNADVLFLLQIIGEKMADFLRKQKDTFKHVPMELHLDLAAGGKLDTNVLKVIQVEQQSLDLTMRGTLGSPFVIPENYEEQQRRPAPKPDKKDERPD